MFNQMTKRIRDEGLVLEQAPGNPWRIRRCTRDRALSPADDPEFVLQDQVAVRRIVEAAARALESANVYRGAARDLAEGC